MYNLIFFVLGIIFIKILIPFMDSIEIFIETKSEKLKYKDMVEIAKYTQQIHNIQEDDDSKPLFKMGFCASSEETSEKDDDE